MSEIEERHEAQLLNEFFEQNTVNDTKDVKQEDIVEKIIKHKKEYYKAKQQYLLMLRKNKNER